MALYWIPQKKTTNLSTVGGITTAAQTTGIKVADVTGVEITKAGILCLNWSNPIDETKFEYITYTSIDGTNELQGVTRGAEGSTARTAHSNGVTVAWTYSKSHINEINDAFTDAFDTTNMRLKMENLYAADAGASDTYAITLSPVPTAYTTGMIVNFKANTANTGACTLNVNTLGAKAIKKNTSADLDTGDILANQIVSVFYDGTNFQIMSYLSGFITSTSTVTLTNKRITQRVVTQTDDASAVIDCDITDQYQLSAVANATEFTVTGTPTDGQKLIIRYKDAGVAKGLTFTGFTALGATIPTTSVAGKWGYVGAIFNTAANTWHVLVATVES